ncbi:MAG: hypothetical protein H0T46_37145 [Deltaproteobacteria bacterium]|nr:hypothetical protein [Deltaproteobacteria bacterium]
MKAPWLVVALVSMASAEARSPRRPPPPLDRNCREVPSKEQLLTCIDTHEKGATVSTLSPDVLQVATKSSRHYVYARLGQRWLMVYHPGDANYELVRVTATRMRDLPAKRIELGHHVQLANTGMFTERVTLLCPLAAGSCEAFVTACTVMQRGRAIETFRGEIVAVDGGYELVGDRAHTGQTCRGR